MIPSEQSKDWLISEYEEALVLAKAIGRNEGYDLGYDEGYGGARNDDPKAE